MGEKILVGTFPVGMSGGTLAFQDIEGPLLAEAAARLDAERAERERVARQTLVVDRAFFDEAMKALDRALAVEWRWWARRNLYRRDLAAGKIRWLREWWAWTLESNKGPPT